MTTDKLILDTIIPVGRRKFLVGGAALTAFGLPSGVLAQAQKTHSHMQGAVEVTVLSDGHLTMPGAVIGAGAPQDEFLAFMEQVGGVPETIDFELNITLLRTSTDLILVDNGSGDKFQPTAGRLFANLAMNGVSPADITKVVITHAHPDHVWGTLAADGSHSFPNAEYFIGAAEFEFWMNPDIFNMLPADFHPFAQGAQRDLAAMKDRLTLVKDGDQIAAGVSVIDAPGHTMGHIAVLVEDGGGLIILGDAVPSEVLHLAHPEWTTAFDADAERTGQTRRRLLDRATADGNSILGFHFTYPGVGNVEKAGEGFAFTAMG